MSSYTSDLVVTPMPNGRDWKVKRKFSFYIGEEKDQNIITVPCNFITDFASVPTWLSFIFPRIITFLPRIGKAAKASVLHDYLYQTHEKTRKEADDIFLEAMQISGVGKYRYLYYYAVRYFGWLVY